MRNLSKTVRGLRSAHGARDGARGQSLVEFAIIVPLFMVLLLGLLEFGFIFAHHQGLEYATREGARTGSGLASMGSGVPCAEIDGQIIASVQRVITGKGSLVALEHVKAITIYKADTDGNPTTTNTWTNTGLGTGPSVDGARLSFSETSAPWSACARDNGGTPDRLGVGLTYDYQLITPLGAMLKWVGADQLTMNDKTVMVLNP